jgi:hypothetical protein
VVVVELVLVVVVVVVLVVVVSELDPLDEPQLVIKLKTRIPTVRTIVYL